MAINIWRREPVHMGTRAFGALKCVRQSKLRMYQERKNLTCEARSGGFRPVGLLLL